MFIKSPPASFQNPHYRWLLSPTRLNGVPFDLKPGRLCFHAARVFFVQLPFRFQSPPVRGELFLAFTNVFIGGTGSDVTKDSGGDGVANAGTMLSGQELADTVDCHQPALRDTPHSFVDFNGGGNDTGPCPPALAHLIVNFNHPGQAFAIVQFLAPAFPHPDHRSTSSVARLFPGDIFDINSYHRRAVSLFK